jgi:hypothetical protein
MGPFYYIGVDLLEELHLLDHGFDFSLKIDSDKSGVVAVLSHLGEVSFEVLSEGLKIHCVRRSDIRSLTSSSSYFS